MNDILKGIAIAFAIALVFAMPHILMALEAAITLPFKLRKMRKEYEEKIREIREFQHPVNSCPWRDPRNIEQKCICGGKLINLHDGKGLTRVYEQENNV